jgi:hypothetical protein
MKPLQAQYSPKPKAQSQKQIQNTAASLTLQAQYSPKLKAKSQKPKSNTKYSYKQKQGFTEKTVFHIDILHWTFDIRHFVFVFPFLILHFLGIFSFLIAA